MRHVYLHGFASGPRSRKAQAFRDALAGAGFELEIPDLAEGDFEHLTISRQLRVIEELLSGESARLIGSSMGGYLATLYAAAHPEIDRLVLLAPAFCFATRWAQLMGDDKLLAWKQTGQTQVFHYGDNALRTLSYDLYQDALNYPDEPDFHQSAHIFHGLNDTVVPVGLSRQFASSHSQTQLTELDSDHELLNVLEHITDIAVPFLVGELQSSGGQRRPAASVAPRSDTNVTRI
jgi:pimeloyl-ACP methyl ester carboxylesterase